MLKLFTKQDVQDMIDKGMTFRQIQDEMGFENIGQGWGYKSYEAWTLGMYTNTSDKYICYVPEYCYSDDTQVKQISVDNCYTRKDFNDLCFDRVVTNPEFLFESVDWQHPSSLLDEWNNGEEVYFDEHND